MIYGYSKLKFELGHRCFGPPVCGGTPPGRLTISLVRGAQWLWPQPMLGLVAFAWAGGLLVPCPSVGFPQHSLAGSSLGWVCGCP